MPRGIILLLLSAGCGREITIAPDPVTTHAVDATTTAIPSAPSAVPSAALSPDWCSNGAGRANDTIAAHVRVSARWAVRAVLRSSIGRELARDGAIDPRVHCPMPATCDDEHFPSCQYAMRFGAPDHDGILRTREWVYVNARTGTISASGIVVPAPIALP